LEEIRHAVEVMLSGGVHLPRAAALEAGGRLPGADPDFGEVRLSRRQAGILRGMLAGRTEVEIAGDLGLTPAVVRLHRAALLRALERAGPASDVRPLAAPETIEVGRAQLAETRGAGPGEAAAADMLDALFNAVPAPLIATRAAGPVGFPQIVYVNDHFCEFYGMTRPFLLRSTTGVLAGPKTDLSRLRAMRRRVGEEIVRVAMTSYGGRGDAKRVRIDIARFPYGPAAGEGTLWLALHVPLFDLALPDRRGE
jgi:PAS domain-containing protein